MLNASATSGSPVIHHNRAPKTAPATHILFSKSQLLSPRVIDKTATKRYEKQSHKGNTSTPHDAPAYHELEVVISEIKNHVHHEAAEGFV